ncbi:hypothetical protein ColLi_12597 [Colletotrichum liriopes]|uniref:Uncharacterized protein n=1 Tax=Colletotrichum liriopes TaxID=708192 RepID=A0AA37GYN8_9PEZI|nr:hypothetical protein ColLi_12597 [Colletotrichum liriopes]
MYAARRTPNAGGRGSFSTTRPAHVPATTVDPRPQDGFSSTPEHFNGPAQLDPLLCPGEGTPLQHGPKRQQVPIWQCCACGHAAMPIRVDPCQICGTRRCAYCPVTKVRVRMTGYRGFLKIEADEEGVDIVEDGVQGVAGYEWITLPTIHSGEKSYSWYQFSG